MTIKGIWRRRSDRRRWVVESLVGLLMLPLSFLPIWWYGSHTADGYLMYLRGLYQLLPPGTPGLPRADRPAVSRMRAETVRGVPVLVYHGIGKDFSGGAGEGYVVSRDHFAEQMRALQSAGFSPVTTRQLASYLSSGSTAALPRRPVLITFDDGRYDAMLQADPILAATHMRATVFVIGATATSGSFYYEQEGALRRYARSGRWELESHTYDLHHLVGETPVLGALRPGETLAAYRRSVAADLGTEGRLVRSLSGRPPVAFAYPFGDSAGAEPRVARTLQALLRARYRLAFDQDEQAVWRFALPGDDPLHVHRLEVGDWTGKQLLGRLARASRRTDAVFAERGLDHVYSPLQLAQAANPLPCPAPASRPLRALPTGGRRLVALGFDDGPSPFTARILDRLERAHARGTFFVVGSQVHGMERLLQRMLVSGDELAVHTWGYPRAKLSATRAQRELVRSVHAVEGAVPQRPCLARVEPGSAVLERAARRLGLSGALWSIDSGDYRRNSPRAIARRVLASVRPGAVVVLHDGGDDQRRRTVEALPLILAGLDRRGYRIVTISQLLADSHASRLARLRALHLRKLRSVRVRSPWGNVSPAFLPTLGRDVLVPHVRLRHHHASAPTRKAKVKPPPVVAAAPLPGSSSTGSTTASSPAPPSPAPTAPSDSQPAASPPPTTTTTTTTTTEPPGQTRKGGGFCHDKGHYTC